MKKRKKECTIHFGIILGTILKWLAQKFCYQGVYGSGVPLEEEKNATIRHHVVKQTKSSRGTVWTEQNNNRGCPPDVRPLYVLTKGRRGQGRAYSFTIWDGFHSEVIFLVIYEQIHLFTLTRSPRTDQSKTITKSHLGDLINEIYWSYGKDYGWEVICRGRNDSNTAVSKKPTPECIVTHEIEKPGANWDSTFRDWLFWAV